MVQPENLMPFASNAPHEDERRYCVHHLDEAGQVRHTVVFQAIDDKHAIDVVATLPNDSGIELWDDARLVARMDPSPPGCTVLDYRPPRKF